MKWKNEYIVGLTWNNMPFVIAMTLILNMDADAQTILNKTIELSANHICKIAKIQKIELKDLRFNMMSLVKQVMITDDEANDFLKKEGAKITS